MEMDFAQLRIAALLLLAIAAGLFGYSFGWERGEIAARSDSDRRFQIVQEQLARRGSVAEQRSGMPAGAPPRPASPQPPA
jgi:hypothetical protein